jgi:hypothetical protein
MKRFVFLVFLLSLAFAKAQSINNYKYVVVDNQYEFQNEANQFRLNELIVFELKKYGIEAFRNNAVIPLDMNRGLCNTLYVQVEKTGFLTTNLDYKLVDCSGTVIMELPRGSNQIKNYEQAYFRATRDAFGVLGKGSYVYEGRYSKAMPSAIVSSMTVGATVPKVMEETREEKPELVEVSKTIDAPVANKTERIIMDYTQNSEQPYSLKFNDSSDNFDLYNSGIKVGSGRKSGSGVYLVSTDEFTGIGFIENEFFIIEYDKDGSVNRIKMNKVN